MDKVQIAQSQFLDPFNEALNLLRRYQEGQGFRAYIRERNILLAPVALLILATSVACAGALVMYLGGTRSVLVLLSMLIAPFVLVGSLFVQAYVFVSWLEGRALAQALNRKPKAKGPISARLLKHGIDMGAMPPVPWVLATLFVFLPFVMLWSVTPGLALGLVLLHVAAPVVFARLDR
jgi:hypothetical protein